MPPVKMKESGSSSAESEAGMNGYGNNTMQNSGYVQRMPYGTVPAQPTMRTEPVMHPVQPTTGYVPVQITQQRPALDPYTMDEPRKRMLRRAIEYTGQRDLLPGIAAAVGTLYGLFLIGWLIAALLRGGQMPGVLGAALLRGMLLRHVLAALAATVMTVAAYHTDLQWTFGAAALLWVISAVLFVNLTPYVLIPMAITAWLFIQSLCKKQR